jgi:hypothetical protein
MKKKILKNLQLRKSSISILENLSVKGGNTYDSRIICPEPDTEGADCNTNATGCQTFASYCDCGTY